MKTDEALDILKKLKDDMDYFDSVMSTTYRRVALDIVINSTKWNKVKYRELTPEERKQHPNADVTLDCPIPKDGEHILVAIRDEDGYGNAITFVSTMIFWHYENTYREEEDDFWEGKGNVIAWMRFPLPPPYYESEDR